MQVLRVPRVEVLLALALWLLAAALPSGAMAQSTGQWALGPNLPWYPVHAHLLPDGQVMMWPGDQGISGNDPRAWNPSTGAITSLAKPGFDVFCTGHSFLPDGRLFVAGGHISNHVGLREASIYNPFNNSWTRQPQMNAGRWYPTNVTLPNGDVLVVSGNIDTTTGINPLPQVWQSASGTWRSLTSAELNQPYYPYMFLAPNGRVFDAGPSTTTRYLDTSGSGSWSFVGNRPSGVWRDYGSAIMYAPGKILIAGGATPPTRSAEVIDLNAASPSWRAVAPMAFARRQMNMTVLPDGKVLVTGGTRGDGFNNTDPALAVYAAELWDPATEQWTTLASSSGIPRLYHSIALLLPDARVLVTGGNGTTQTEIFSPPYLFAGSRPTISSAPAAVGKGQTFLVGTPDGAGVNSVAWVGLPSVTHTATMGQGFYRSTSITQAAGGVNITAPNLTTVPPGYYMLFLLQNGVPSVARMVRLDNSVPSNPVPTLSSISPSSTAAGSAGFTLTASGSDFVSGSVIRWNGSDRATSFVSPTQLTAAIGAGDVAAAGTAQVTVSSPSPGGGTSAAQTFTISSTPPPPNGTNLAASGTPTARVTSPTGGGSRNIGVIKDGVMPPVNSTNSALQYDTFDGENRAAEDWIGYTFSSPQSFERVVFQEGGHWVNGGWFTTLRVQVRQAGSWVDVSSLTVAPTYPGTSNGTTHETYTLSFTPTSGDGIRIIGDPGGRADFISVAELQVFGSGSPPPAPTDVTAAGSPIVRVTAPVGGGSRNLGLIKDGVMPPVNSTASSLQYDTYDGPNTASQDWVGYTFTGSRTFSHLIFQEGRHFPDGGWFTTLGVQVRQAGSWVNVSGVTVTPAYPGANNGTTFESYTLDFPAVSGDGIRIVGAPGGSADFISIAELRVFAQ
jgi:hypothetical protein